MGYRFYSDSNQTQFCIDVLRLGLVVHAQGYEVEVLGQSPDLDPLVKLYGGYEEAAEKPNSSIGVEAHVDIAAFSTRSSALNMPGYEPPAVTTIIPKTCIPKIARRATRGQPL